jgi:hypothetical protein
MKPKSCTIRTYQIGFGDCFLLSVDYDSGAQRHCLIDFGTTRPNRGHAGRNNEDIAEDIKSVTGGKLHMLVASHRHKDHISGFAGRSGQIIRSLQPQIVVQPWTEDPTLDPEATAPVDVPGGNQNLVSALGSMQKFAWQVQNQWMQHLGLKGEAAKTDPETLNLNTVEERLHDVEVRPNRLLGVNMPQAVPRNVFTELFAVGLTNIRNKQAVEGLIAMADKAEAGGHYGKFGDRLPLGDIMPAVKVHVLGPPTVDDSASVRTQRHKDSDEFWHMRSRFWTAHARSIELAQEGDLFPDDVVNDVPFAARWAVPRAQRIRVDQLLAIVRALDTALNNTSLILLFEIGDKKLLFPGDAQIENWEFALSKAKEDTSQGRELNQLLSQVDLYKVGHHGSLNATPKTLWNMFAKRSTTATPDRMRSIVSTQASVHGNRSRHTEVPRQTLIKALDSQTFFHSTQNQRKKADYVHRIEMPV